MRGIWEELRAEQRRFPPPPPWGSDETRYPEVTKLPVGGSRALGGEFVVVSGVSCRGLLEDATDGPVVQAVAAEAAQSPHRLGEVARHVAALGLGRLDGLEDCVGDEGR